MTHTAHRLPLRLLVFLILPFGNLAVGQSKPEDNKKSPEAEIHGGLTYDAWIAQAKKAPTLEDRQNAMQVLRNVGLKHDRKRTLRAFAEALADKAPSIRSLAAAGLMKAGKPTDPMALKQLVENLSRDLSDAKPQFGPVEGEGRADREFEFPVREIRALGVLGEKEQIPVLRRIVENKKVHVLLRQFAEQSIQQIQRRENKAKRESRTDHNGVRDVDRSLR